MEQATAKRVLRGLPIGGEWLSRGLAGALVGWRDGLSPAARNAYARRCLKEAKEISRLDAMQRIHWAPRAPRDIYVTAFNVAADPAIKAQAQDAFRAEAAADFTRRSDEYLEALSRHLAANEARDREAMERRLTSPYPPMVAPPYDRPAHGPEPPAPTMDRMPVWDEMGGG